MGHPLPDASQVRELLRDLVGKQVTVELRKDAPPPARSLVAVWADAAGVASTAALCDLPFAASAGAALALVPAGVAEDSVKAKTLDPMLLENLSEVLNVASRWFNQSGAPPVRLGTIYPSSDELPDDVASLVAKPAARRDLTIGITGYSGGTLSLLSA